MDLPNQYLQNMQNLLGDDYPEFAASFSCNSFHGLRVNNLKIKTEDIENAISVASEMGACAVGVPVKDTIKVIDDDNIVVDTPNRATLFAVQTPQIFKADMYKNALERAEKDGKDFTDDCQLIEYAGGRVKMVSGSYDNIKITTPEDISLAENILMKRDRG